MFIASRFDGDENKTLMRIQHDTYWAEVNNIGKLFGYCREHFLDAARLVECESDLVNALQSNNTFDHRTLQDAHDVIAAYHRYSVDKGQPPLPIDGIEYEEFARKRWLAWYREELLRLIEFDTFTRNVCIAAALANPDPRGTAAEQTLCEFLDEHYRKEDGSPFAASFYARTNSDSSCGEPAEASGTLPEEGV